MSDTGKSIAQTDEHLSVYDRLGSIVRSLHDALRQIGADKVLSEVASEFPSARERLLHIGRLTEKAADVVLERVECTAPIQANLALQAKQLMVELEPLLAAHQLPAPVQPLLGATLQFLASASAGCDSTRFALQDIMMAQDFQDLTGQLITKVVTLLETTEKDVLTLLIDAAPPGAVSPVKKEEIMAGPGAPGGVALAQAAVDDLLADLGF